MASIHQCTQRYLSLCGIPPTLNRDGYTGINAHIFVPFCGFVFASGATITFPGSTIPQDQSRVIGGISMPDTFTKTGAACS